VIKLTFLQGSAVLQSVLGGQAIPPLVVNFVWHISAKNYENGWEKQKL